MKKILNVPSEEKLAEMLQDCLEAILLDGMDVQQGIEMSAPWQHLIRPQVEAALVLHAMQSAFDPRPGLLPASKKRVLQRIAQQPAPKQAILPQIRWQNWLARLVTVLALLVLIWVGVGSGLQQVQAATPEQTAYAAKLMLEEARLAFTLGDTTQLVYHRLAYAQTRLDEVDYLIAAKLDGYIPSTLSNYQMQIAQATQVIEALPMQQADLQAQLSSTVAAQLTQNQQRLTAIAQSASPATRAPVEQSLQTVQAALQTVEVTLSVPLPPSLSASPVPNSTNTPLVAGLATQAVAVTTPTNTSTLSATATATASAATVTPTATFTATVTPTATFTATVTLEPTPTGIGVTALPTPETQIKPTKTPKPKPTQKPHPTQKPPPDQRPTKEK